MTKRFGNFADNNSKKLKANDNLDELWGEDLDIKDVDDCFTLATQVWEQDKLTCTQRNNVSILPPYNVFKQSSKNRFTSTQSDPDLSLQFPSTSKTPITNGIQKNLLSAIKNDDAQRNGFKRTYSFESSQSSQMESKFKMLQEQYVAKEGEVSILRTQLKEFRANKESEQNKKQKEWTDKLATAMRQLNAAKSELEFKNLEIANLKQKVVEVAKLNNLDTTLNSTQSPFFKQLRVPEKYTASSPCATVNTTPIRKELNFKNEFKIHSIVEAQYRLQNVIPAEVYSLPREEKFLVDVRNNYMCRNTIPYLQNQMSQELIQRLIQLQPKYTVVDDDRQLNFDHVYCEICKLMKCSAQEIEMEANNVCINKLICVSEQLIHNLYEFLQALEQNLQIDHGQKLATIYLENKLEVLALQQSLFDTREWCDNEMGISARQSISCIAEILPYNSYLRGYLLQNKSLFFEEKEDFFKCLSVVRPKLQRGYSNNFSYLQRISSVVTMIAKLKKSDVFPGLLSSITLLLNKICLCFNIDEMYPLINNITREIIFCGPNVQVIFHFTEFLKNASLQSIFVNGLCKMHATSVLKINQKEKILYYNRDTCVLQILYILLENRVLKMENMKILDIYLNIMKFVSNAIKCNPQWLFYQEDKHCDCLCKIVKLCVEVMYQTVEKFHKNRIMTFTNEQQKQTKILKGGLRILHILNFKVSDLIIKYIATYSQYKSIIKSLLSLKTTLNLTESDVELLDLNTIEEIPVGQDVTFNRISLWN